MMCNHEEGFAMETGPEIKIILEDEGEVRVRNVRPVQNESLLGKVTQLGTGAVEFGLSLMTMPLNILPAESRQHLRNAARELLYAVTSLPGSLADAATEAVKDWASEKAVASEVTVSPAQKASSPPSKAA